jgi:hypothetical protein
LEAQSLKELKTLHGVFIKELYKDREAPVKPFDQSLILGTCSDWLDINKRSEFFRGTKGCIYLIHYKYDPSIYYIGRTTLLKRRVTNHLQAGTGSKLHVFLNLVG